ncbi:uncharacterized protein YecT (DUF1311 family) [Sphingomonas trueperi]|uniref:lysozyme inhibitor LprI family protein n=1 Tax=Sphingomonas trueperi TaxID=53317 RepID=UPI0033995D6A
MLALLAMLWGPAPMPVQAPAWQGELSASFHACMRAAKRWQRSRPEDENLFEIARMACAELEWKRRDRVLNQLTKRVRDRLPPAQRTRLAALERQWVTEREMQCNAETEKHPFESEGVTFYLCRVHATNRRIHWLRAPDARATRNAPR